MEKRYESSRSTSFQEAQNLSLQRKKDVMERKDPIPIKKIANHTFQELAEHYLVWAQRHKSFDSKTYFIKNFIGEFAHCPRRRFTPKSVEEYQTKMLTKKILAVVFLIFFPYLQVPRGIYIGKRASTSIIKHNRNISWSFFVLPSGS